MSAAPELVSDQLSAPCAPHVITQFDPARVRVPDEWLLTNGIGGFAMGTPHGALRRRYHALLVAATAPPVERVCALASLDEVVLLPPATGHDSRHWLSCHRFADGSMTPDGFRRLARFEQDRTSVRWVYQFAGIELQRELILAHGRNACAMRYIVRGAPAGTTIAITPRISMRPSHDVNEHLDTTTFHMEVQERAFRVRRGENELLLATSEGRILESPSILPSLQLVDESERGQPDVEALYTPGLILVESEESDRTIEFEIVASMNDKADLSGAFDTGGLRNRLDDIRRTAHGAAPSLASGSLDSLIDAADAFLVERTVNNRTLTTVLAGYPWFADWGRDTMISLPGLMLTTGRFEDARRCLETFAHYVSDGMIPNRFDEYDEVPHYNTADASLWFIHAACQYRIRTGDEETFTQTLLPACLEIMEFYQAATRYGIRMDPEDGLITAGDETTQLTWMDAKREGVVFTPRHGKAVEINALWYNALCSIAQAVEDRDGRRSRYFRELAARTAASFCERFWRDKDRFLSDCVYPDGKGGWIASDQIRPNQIFAACFESSPLSTEQRSSVVACVREHLLTPVGLRTLAPSDPQYQPRFEGDMRARDRAYHNGTVWPWLLGPFGEAVLRTSGFSQESRGHVRELLRPLVESLSTGCLGQIAEVYDAEEPRRPQGCVAQAWSIAEVLRLAALIEE